MGWASAVSSYRAGLQVRSRNEGRWRSDWPGWPPDSPPHLKSSKREECESFPIITPLQFSYSPHFRRKMERMLERSMRLGLVRTLIFVKNTFSAYFRVLYA